MATGEIVEGDIEVKDGEVWLVNSTITTDSCTRWAGDYCVVPEKVKSMEVSWCLSRKRRRNTTRAR
jgi:hypothetical protein